MRAVGLFVLLSLACVGCGPLVDLSKGLEVLDVTTGLADMGIVNGENRLVPSVTFKLKNVSDQNLIALQVNAVFRKVGQTVEWGSAYVIVAQSEGLAPGATSKSFTLNSTLGYHSLKPRADMLTDALFVDTKVELAAKYASAQWKKIAEYPIERRILAR